MRPYGLAPTPAFVAVAFAWAAAGACASASSSDAGGGPQPGLCDRLNHHASATSIHYASLDAVHAAAGHGVVGEPVCAQDDPSCRRQAVYVYRDVDHSGTHSVVVATASGFEGYPGLFEAGSGACCEWAPESTVRGDGTWLIVRQAGEAGVCAHRECTANGVLVQFAVFDRASGAFAFALVCDDSPSASLVGTGGKFVLSNCHGRDATFGLGAVGACLAP